MEVHEVVEDHTLKKNFGDEVSCYLYDRNSLNDSDGGHIYQILKEIELRSSEKFSYKFLNSSSGLMEMIKNNDAFVTILFDEGVPIAFNVSLLIRKENFLTLVFGLSLAAKNTALPSKMEMMGSTYMDYAVKTALKENKRLYGACMANANKTLDMVDKVFYRLCYPFRGNWPYPRLAKELLKARDLAFENYIVPNFPKATLCPENSLVTTDKVSVGFNESWSDVLTYCSLERDQFWQKVLKKPEAEDILFYGDIITDSLSIARIRSMINIHETMLKFNLLKQTKRNKTRAA